MLKNKKVWLLILLELLVVLFITYQCHGGTERTRTFQYDNNNFAFHLEAGRGNCLYEAEDRGWFGDGEVYTVWQIEDIKPLLDKLNWQSGQPFQHELFQTVTDLTELDTYYLPNDLKQQGWYYYIGQDKDGYEDDRMLLILVPEVKMGDGLQYKHLLFIVELYS